MLRLRPLLPVLALVAAAAPVSGLVLLSSDFAGIARTDNRFAVTWATGSANFGPAPAGTIVDGVTFGVSGAIYGLLGNDANASMRTTGLPQVQFNAAADGRAVSTPPNDQAVMSFAVTVAEGFAATISQASFVLGTAATGGTGYGAVSDLGDYQLTFSNDSITHSFHAAPAALDGSGGTLPTTIAVPDAPIVLGEGNWRVSLVHSAKPSSGNGGQRTTLGSFQLEGTVAAIPEPSTFAAIALAFGLTFVGARRRRR